MGVNRPPESTIRTSNAAFTRPDVPGTPSWETALERDRERFGHPVHRHDLAL